MTDQRRDDGVERVASEPARGPAPKRASFTPQQRLLVLDAWQRSQLSAREFSSLVGVSGHTLYAWKKLFERDGPAGLSDQPRKRQAGSSRLSAATQRAILMMKQSHPDWGVDRIHAMLLRGDGYAASPGAIQRVLLAGGYELETTGTRQHAEPRPRRFERARPNQLWQSDLFTFTLKREGRRLYLVAFLDDFSRFIVGHAIQASSAGALVREALESGIANFGPPEEVLTDNGPQYHSWRGKSALTKLLERRGIRHIVARPRHPQTLGKTERFWGTLWRESLEQAVFRTIEEARGVVLRALEDANEKLSTLNGDVTEALSGLIDAVGAFNSFRERVEGDQQAYFDDRSESWRECDEGCAYLEWMVKWEEEVYEPCVGLPDEYELDVAEDECTIDEAKYPFKVKGS